MISILGLEDDELAIFASVKSRIYLRPGDVHVNPAAACDATAPPTAASSSENPADPASLNWTDSKMAEVGANDGYTVVKGKKRRRGSTSPEHAARQPNKPGEQRSSQQRKRPTGPRAVPPHEIKATRANIADAKARQATTNHENYVFVELCPDIPDYLYFKAMSTLLGGARGITQFNRMNGHYIVGLESKDLANRLVADGLEIEGTTLKVFPFRKRAERIVVANLPGFVEDSTIVTALGQFGRVTSIAPILVKMGEFTFTDGRREAFILLREGVRLETLPTRLTIQSKGDTLSAFLSFGIKCSKCGKQGHRRANCPALARQGNSSPRQAASPTDARPPPPSSSATKEAGTCAGVPCPTGEDFNRGSGDPLGTPSCRTDGCHPPRPCCPPCFPGCPAAPPEPRISPLDHEMLVEKLTSPPSTPARGKSALKQLLKHIEETPSLSIDWDKLPGLNCKDAQQLLTSETTMKRLAPTLTETQVATLDELHETFKASCPDSNSTIRKTLQKTRKEASNILGLNHRAVPTAQLLDELIVEEHIIARPTRSALADAATLGAFCRRLTSENTVGFGAESTPSSSSLAAAVVLRGTATPFLNGLTTRSARRALDRPRLAATPISRFLARWTPTLTAALRLLGPRGRRGPQVSPPRLAPSSPSCLGLIREAFNIIGRPPDLQAWIFGGSGLEDDALSILASAKLRIYRYFVQVGLGEAVEDPLIAWSRTLQRRGLLPSSPIL
ncbi:hypothetical protein LAZ67_5003913 [Cordylochernes scorpioides]|uniref:CCHC-type domain-containing protein n=1 Tax=Cordylochernes scorpioides TaxID=51811 RepID=A0ABY6KIM9_9ARAC|nr:hypothetical protein LAZ67_5003913 [Cordylochernes scorpioides]